MKKDSLYYKKHANRKPREQLLRAIEFCANKDVALDLGAGNLIESKALLNNGFKKVIAVDSSPEVNFFYKNIKSKNLEFKNISFQEFDLPKNHFDLINAQYSLPFHGKRFFKNFVRKIVKSLKIGGVFTGQFFGKKDEWNYSRDDLVFNTKKEIEAFFKGLKIVELIEEEKEQETVSGKMKHWHIFHFIVLRK